MNNYTLLLCTGAPGSAWSMVSNRLKKSFEEFDLSDETPERLYSIPISNRAEYQVHRPSWKMRTHDGSYFGPYNEFGNHFDEISNHYTKEQFLDECVKPYSDDTRPFKLIRSHWFAYNLDWIWENCKGHKLLLIWRDPEVSRDWWYSMGGWNINYPVYTWYDNPERMWIKIQEESNNILDFAQRKNIKWNDYTGNIAILQTQWGTGTLTNYRPKASPIFNDTIKFAIVEIV
jgi:hypothetical protein